MQDESVSVWASSVVLGNGDTAFLRPLVPADQAALLAFHERQSSDSTYRRFFSPKPSLTSTELTHFTTVDMVDRAALAVELHDEFIAWASYERWPGRAEAEAAFMVDDEHHGQGIATLLLEHLAAVARSNGIERFTAEVLADNRAMLAVFAKAGWPLQRRFESGVVDLDWELAQTDEFIDSVERREQRADSRAVGRILAPRAIAVVGASDRPGSLGKVMWDHVANSASVPLHAVNPRLAALGDMLDGHPCVGSVDELPDDVSLAIIAIAVRHLEATIDQCIAKRMRGAVIISNTETPPIEHIDLDLSAMVARARRNGLRIIGPSSMGIASFGAAGPLQASIVDVDLPAGNVAISLQGGALGISMLRRAQELDLGLSWVISLGSKNDISGNDLLQFWEEDSETGVIGMYTESFGKLAEVRAVGPPGLTAEAHRGREVRSRRRRLGGQRVVSPSRGDRGAHRARVARHRAHVVDTTGPHRAAGRGHHQTPRVPAHSPAMRSHLLASTPLHPTTPARSISAGIQRPKTSRTPSTRR